MSIRTIPIDGGAIATELDFHHQVGKAVDVETFYGCNLDALWDLLSANN